jgi:hypothetical protein
VTQADRRSVGRTVGAHEVDVVVELPRPVQIDCVVPERILERVENEYRPGSSSSSIVDVVA